MRPDVNLLPDICEALRITLYQLYALEDPTVQYTAAEELFMADYRQLSPGHKLAVRSLTDTLLQVQTAEEQPEVQPCFSSNAASRLELVIPASLTTQAFPYMSTQIHLRAVPTSCSP